MAKKNPQKSLAKPARKWNRSGGQNGGSKPGAGRPQGTPNKVTQELRDKVLASGKSPLEVMTYVMNEHLRAAEALKEQVLVVDGRAVTRLSLLRQASDIAASAAPYLHPKLQTIEHSGPGGEAIPVSLTVEFVEAKHK